MNHSIRVKLVLFIAGPILVVFVVALLLTMAKLRADARAETEDEMTRLARNYAARFDGAFREAAVIARTTARFLETHPGLPEDEIFQQLRFNVLQNDVVYGAAMAFEPGTFPTDKPLFCPYVFRAEGGLQQMNIGIDVLDWYTDTQWQWWHLPRDSGRGAWSAPYFDEGAGNVLMVTFSEPFKRDGEFRGVTTVDIMLPTLHERLGHEILSDLEFIILAPTGQFVYSPIEDEIMTKTVFDLAREVGREDVAEAGRRIISGESGVTMIQGFDRAAPERQWVFYSPIASTGWGFAALVSEREAMAGHRNRMWIAAGGMAGTVLVIILLVLVVAGKITRPIDLLHQRVLEIADGNLDVRVDHMHSQDEIGELARGFNTMTEHLRQVVGRVKHASIQMHSTSTQLLATSREQEATASSFGTSANRIAAAVTQISATGSELATTMGQVNDAAVHTAQLAGQGHDDLQQLEATMRGLDAATSSIAEKLAMIRDKTSNIATIVRTITKVADQTNLLSVNATIEAEKAGQYGVGFLVVAREIRRLADLTASATLDIERIVGEVDSSVSAGVVEMDRFTGQARDSVKEAVLVSEQMGTIIAQVAASTSSFERINEGMRNQSSGAEEISSAMGQLSADATRTTEAAREYASAAHDLQSAITALKSSIAAFQMKQ